MIKRVLSLALVAGLAACGGGDSNERTPDDLVEFVNIDSGSTSTQAAPVSADSASNTGAAGAGTNSPAGDSAAMSGTTPPAMGTDSTKQ